MPLDDATTALLTQMAQYAAPPLSAQRPAEVRAAAAATEVRATEPAMLRTQDHRVPTGDGSAITVRVLTPSEQPRAVIVYLHGGGWVVGTIDGFEGVGRELAARNDAVVVMVDYRLAPEFPYPTPGEDAWAAVLWTAERVAALAGSVVPLVLAGDSAGATLATVCARRARDEARPVIAAQVLVYPATDCDLDRPSYVDPANHLLLDRDAMQWFWGHYLAEAARRQEPDASPLRTPDLSGLPPTVLVTAEYDVLRDEGEAYGDRLEAAGVPVDRRRFDGQTHGFFGMVGVLPGSASALEWISDRLQARLAATAGQPAGEPAPAS